ncbi:hypothetical protein HCX50_04015 [Microbacterium oxydans]|uniref:hypothetical protein n=1 Tax=Microbacterium sp. B19(2022) TaxID=2914045 RepID=UPI00142F7D34|nr:hypothetical protein [Microbacterium sp. B19(2022)]NJI58592.1 hypothetical protein [Microbacterium sp. B19(2022)]
MSELDDLRARVDALEQTNQTARHARGHTGRSVIAGILIVLALVTAPLAAVGAWARVQLVDTDSFVATFAPLSEHPAVQRFITEEVSAAIHERVDFAAVLAPAFDRLRSLEPSPRSAVALSMLERSAGAGLASLVDTAVEDLVASDQFSTIWEHSLRFGHTRGIAVLDDDTESVLQIADDGLLSVDLGLIADRVRTNLLERGIGVAELIPSIDRSIPVAHVESLVEARTIYRVVLVAGLWLPFVVIGMLVGGLLVAVRRPRAMLAAGTAFAATFALLSVGIAVAGTAFASSLGANPTTVNAAQVAYAQLTGSLLGASGALILLGASLAMTAWFTGPSLLAVRVRNTVERGFTSLRERGDARGISTGRFGQIVDRYRVAALAVALFCGVVVMFTARPLTAGTVVAVGFGLLVFMVILGVVRRPAAASDNRYRMEPAENATTT